MLAEALQYELDEDLDALGAFLRSDKFNNNFFYGHASDIGLAWFMWNPHITIQMTFGVVSITIDSSITFEFSFGDGRTLVIRPILPWYLVTKSKCAKNLELLAQNNIFIAQLREKSLAVSRGEIHERIVQILK